MTNILVAFPKLENCRSMRSILVRSGYPVTAVCTTGAQILNYVEEWDSGIILCGYRMPDYVYSDLLANLPPGFQMLVVASPQHCGEMNSENLLYLSMPFKVNDVVNTVEMMVQAHIRYKKKKRRQPTQRSEADQKIIDAAKALLMERNHMEEYEAHRYLQKTSMENGTNLVETAQMVLSVMQE